LEKKFLAQVELNPLAPWHFQNPGGYPGGYKGNYPDPSLVDIEGLSARYYLIIILCHPRQPPLFKKRKNFLCLYYMGLIAYEG